MAFKIRSLAPLPCGERLDTFAYPLEEVYAKLSASLGLCGQSMSSRDIRKVLTDPYSQQSSYPHPYSLQPISRHRLNPSALKLIDLGFATPEIHIFDRDKPRFLDHLVAKEQRGEDGNIDIRRNE